MVQEDGSAPVTQLRQRYGFTAGELQRLQTSHPEAYDILALLAASAEAE